MSSNLTAPTILSSGISELRMFSSKNLAGRSALCREHEDSEPKSRVVLCSFCISVGFSMGFTCTAFIPEEEASRFLYWYPSGSLADVMDKEVRGRIQQAAAGF